MFVNKQHFTSQNLLIISALISCAFYWYLIEKTGFLYIQYDAYYYSAVADGLIEDGEWSNKVTTPPSNLRTPQNGIVVIHALLRMLGIDDIQTRLKLLAFINALLISVITFLCYKLYLLAGIHNSASWLLSLTIPITFYYLMVLLQPINDAIFIALSYFALFVIFAGKPCAKYWILLLALAAVVPLFRLAGLLLFVTPALVFLFDKKYRLSLLFAGLAVFSLLSPFILNILAGFNMPNIETRGSEIVSGYNLTYISEHLYKTLSLSIPEALLRITYLIAGFTISGPWAGFIISAALLFMLALTTREALAKHNTVVLMIIVFVVLNLVFFQLHPAQPTRYLLVLSPLLPMMFFIDKNSNHQRNISLIIISFTLLISFLGLTTNEKFAEASQKQQFSEQLQRYTQDKKYELLSYFPRVSYFLLRKSAAKTLDHALNKNPDKLLVVGPNEYQSYIFQQLSTRTTPVNITELPFNYIDYTRSAHKQFETDYVPIQIQAIWITLNSVRH